jgi:hypothetical protein
MRSRFLDFFSCPFIALLVMLSVFVIVTVDAGEAAAPQTAIDWKAVGGNTLLSVLQVLGAGIATLLGAALLWVCRSLAKKFNIQMSAEQDQQVYAAADKAVRAAEEWARKYADKPTGSEKADAALKIMREVLDSKTYAEYGEPALRKLLDAALSQLRAQEGAGSDGPVEAK